MPVPPNNRAAATLTLLAGVAQGPLPLDVSGSRFATLVIKNGAQPIDTVLLERTALGALWGVEAGASTAPSGSLPPIAANATVMIDLGPFASQALRLTLGSTAGTTASYELVGK